MSERFRRSSTKYGPSVSAGRTTHPVAAGDEDDAGVGVGDVGEVGVAVVPLPHPNTPAASEPMKMTTSRRAWSGSSFRFMPSSSWRT
jgi:hypothetical protein